MPKLIENTLIGGRVRLAGEEISEADAKNVRPEVFATEVEPAAPESDPDASDTEQDKPATEPEPAAKQTRRRGAKTQD